MSADIPDHAAREHSEHGASITERWWNCPGSVALVRGMPNTSGVAAELGTAQHELAQMCLTNNQAAEEYVGRVVHGHTVTAEMAEQVQVYLDDCNSLVDTVLRSEMQIEVRFDLSSLRPPAPMFGTADFVAYNPLMRRLFVKDYKNGFVGVDAVGNKQGRYYALGAMVMLGPDQPVSDVEITIVQPNGLGEPVKRELIGAVDLAEWSLELFERAAATLEPDAPCVPGSWCDKTYCPARGSCAARAKARLANAAHDFDSIVSNTDTPPAAPEVRLLTPAQKSAILRAADGIRDFLKAVEADVLAAVNRGDEGYPFKLVATQARAAWKDPATAETMLSALHEIDPWEPRSLVSPAQARERLAEKIRPEHKTKKAATEAARAALADLTHAVSSGTRLVPVADPRPAVPMGGAEFINVPTE